MLKESGWKQRFISANRLKLFLDYDGTLSNFAPTPDDIRPDPKLISLIQGLIDAEAITPVVISGRRLSHIQKLIPLTGIILAGTYGIERQQPDGAVHTLVEHNKVRPTLDRIKPHWNRLVEDYPELYLEDKDWSLALHAKNLSEETAAEVLSKARAILVDDKIPAEKFRILGGHKFLEIAPLQASKQYTVEDLLSDHRPEKELAVYFGDDDKDEEAFIPIRKADGIAIRVGPPTEDSHAAGFLDSPDDLRQVLWELLDTRSSRGSYIPD